MSPPPSGDRPGGPVWRSQGRATAVLGWAFTIGLIVVLVLGLVALYRWVMR